MVENFNLIGINAPFRIVEFCVWEWKWDRDYLIFGVYVK